MSMQGGEYSTERLLGVGRLGFGLGTTTHNLVGTERQPVAAESNFCRRRRQWRRLRLRRTRESS